MPINQPNSRYPHLYVVIRVDEPADSRTPVEMLIALVAAFQDEAQAVKEVDRLNTLNAGKGSRYSVQVTRLKD